MITWTLTTFNSVMAYLQSIDIEAKEVLQFLTLSIYIISQNNLGEVIAAWYAL